MENVLYYGDNLQVLREHVRDESVDLVYLDPPFNSNQDYNVLFAERDGSRAAAQIKAFGDTWRWDQGSAAAFHDVVEHGPQPVSRAMQAFRTLVGESDVLAYLSMMAPRLVELHRVLKPTGSIYLHCDPTASHYIKVMMDGIFGHSNFRSEIIWKRSSAHSDAKQGRKDYGHIHDTILFYTAGEKRKWNVQFTPYDSEYVKDRFKNFDDRGHYKDADLTAARPGGDTLYDWRIKRPAGGKWTDDLDEEYKTPKEGWEYRGVKPSSGRYWAYSRENMAAFARGSQLHYFASGMPRLKQHAHELPGIPLQDIWTDIPPINSQAKERLGYPTQKPIALLRRIVAASTDPGDVVFDPFCGCGTAIYAAQELGREWVGCDIAILAIRLIEDELRHRFGLVEDQHFRVDGIPNSVEAARTLWEHDPFQFEHWAVERVGGFPTKKTGDKGIDGRIYFETGKDLSVMVLSVKGGHARPTDIRDLIGVLSTERDARLAGFISLREPTKAMKEAAAQAGIWEYRDIHYPRVQMLTVREIVEEKRSFQMPTKIGVKTTSSGQYHLPGV